LGGLQGSEGFQSGEFTAEGGLDRETVRLTILKAKNQIRACFEKALISNPTASGRITFDWTITPSGPTSQVQIVKNTSTSPLLASCVQEVIAQMIFPKAANGKSTRVIYPFEFQKRI
jgi:hypothetical protein